MRKPKAPKFVDFNRQHRPVRSLENLTALFAACDVQHRQVTVKPNGPHPYQVWRMFIRGVEHYDISVECLAELSSLCRAWDVVSPVVPKSDILALRMRLEKEGKDNAQ